MRPDVTIITATYNHQEQIGDCIESVLNQSYESWEMLVADDGSTDRTWSVIQSYAQSEPRIRAFRQPNRGIWRLAETYNLLLSQARGELIAILEGDDFWPSNKLEIQTQLHRECPSAIFSYGATGVVSSNGENLGMIEPATPPGIYSSLEFLQEILLRRSGTLPVSCVLDTSALRAIGGFSSLSLVPLPGIFNVVRYPAVDYPTFTCLFANSAGTIIRDPRVLGYWRKHKGQTTDIFRSVFNEGMYQIAQYRFSKLSRNQVREITCSMQDIHRAHRIFLGDGYLQLLRHSLRQKDHVKSLAYARRMFAIGTLKRKLQAFYGIALALTAQDMEHLYRAYERLLPNMFLKDHRSTPHSQTRID